ncbi:serine/threonine-protein kinase [Methanotorris igneus]|uniref:Serine/threonine protein kinase n=1 Tax=Methanotorris igneus (strain DSM 5666 / JCM 11834 / Kol 5) TaxID=880724 RepID=F6BEU8_METIK|nr:serine/threonine-protein kinase [Methanotorris igneus]AEF95684.1 serine/threonine protein kinase [Methanotorris igneus Kol 5]
MLRQNVDYLLNNAKKYSEEGKEKYNKKFYSEAIELFNKSIEEYEKVKSISLNKNNKELFNKAVNNITTLKKLILNSEFYIIQNNIKTNLNLKNPKDGYKNLENNLQELKELHKKAEELKHSELIKHINTLIDKTERNTDSLKIKYLKEEYEKNNNNITRLENLLNESYKIEKEIKHYKDNLRELQRLIADRIIELKINNLEKNTIAKANLLYKKKEYFKSREVYKNALKELNDIEDYAVKLKIVRFRNKLNNLKNLINENIRRLNDILLSEEKPEKTVELIDIEEINLENIQYTPKTPEQFTPKPYPASSLPYELAQNYKDVELIGQGGFARVFKAVRIKDNLPVAIKIPISLDPQTGKSFINELKIWSSLDHPNIVKVYDYNVFPIPYIEMELCDADLNEYMKTKKLSLREISFLIFNIAEGLKYVHSKGIIHRDLKPHNILLKDGIPKISDWGLSKVISQSTSTTRGGFTPYYAAPEQIRKEIEDERTDIWQLGVIFYQLTTNQLPFKGDNLREIDMNILTKKPTPPKEINPEIDDTLNKIILKCLNKKPEDRYQSVLELQKDLAKYLQITFKEELSKSITTKDFSRSAYYCGDLILLNLKINNGVEAYKYIGDLIHYAKGEVKEELLKLKEAVKYRVENNIPIPYEIVKKAEVIIHKIRLGFKS